MTGQTLPTNTNESLFILRFVFFSIEYLEISELIETKLKFHPRPNKNKLKCNRTMSEVFNAQIQLIKRIKPPVIDTFFEPTLSTNRPSMGEKTNIPRVW